MNINEISNFLNQLYTEINEAGIDVTNLKIDHIAYSTASDKEYDELMPEFLNQSKLIQEKLIKNRRVSMFKLNTPIVYKNSEFDVIELIEPVAGEAKNSEWEHAEFLIGSYDNFMAMYPNLPWDIKHKNAEFFSRIKLTLPSNREVKFLDMPVLKAAELENNN